MPNAPCSVQEYDALGHPPCAQLVTTCDSQGTKNNRKMTELSTNLVSELVELHALIATKIKNLQASVKCAIW